MKVSLEFDETLLGAYTDERLAALWHAIQNCDAPQADPVACEIAEIIGREIIRRWLARQAPPLWNRQGTHASSPRRAKNTHAEEVEP